jgi:Protein of unknown function (DUF2975)
MAHGGKLIGVADILVRLLMVLNIVCTIGFAIAILASFPFSAQIVAKIAAKYHGTVDPGLAQWGIRGAMALGIAVAVPAAAIFRALRAMLVTVRCGDPFVVENARHLSVIGWALFVIQILDLVFGLLIFWMRHLGADTATWSPSIGGWLSVLVAFVLARVFIAGAKMRDDLEGTV